MRRGVPLLLLAACHSSSLTVPPDRPILLWSGSSAADANAAALPGGFTAPDASRCARDPTRAYLGELFANGIDNPQVLWHWAPVVPGPQAARPTLQQPEFSLAGAVTQTDDSTDDVLADHPFGFDVNVDVAPDPPYAFLPFEQRSSSMLHTEVEMRTFPRDALGFAPQAGDRVLQRGAWILDCGHPPYGAEMHPPTFTIYARQADANTTVAAAAVMPYRSSLLFNQDAGVATALASTARFGFSDTKPFPLAMVDAIEFAVLTSAQHISTHSLMIGNRFDSLDFLVCAPLPRPAGATLFATWRFTARTGISVQPTPLVGSGCVRFIAAMGGNYTPMPLAIQTTPWTWQELSDSASSQLGQSVDVRQAIIDALQQRGLTQAASAPALQESNPPLIDAYAALQTSTGADQDAPTQVAVGADSQPFPLYGRVRVAWKTP